jgi:transglutaminase-like putative cysteine protease
MGRLTSWFRLEEGWLTVFLVMIMVGAVVWSIDDAKWVEGTGIMYPATVFGVLAGLLLAKTRMRAWLAVVVGGIAGAIFSFVFVGEVLPSGAALFANLADLVNASIAWVRHPVGPPPIAGALAVSGANAAGAWQRVVEWVQVIVAGKASTDNIMFVMVMAALAWGMGSFAAFALYRWHDPVLAALPTGIALAVNLTFIGPLQGPFFLFLAALLLLMVRVQIVSLRQRWERLNLDYSPELFFDIVVWSLVIILFVGTVSTTAPRAVNNPLAVAFWQYLGDQWAEVENAVNRLFSGVTNPNPSSDVAASGSTLILRGNVRLTKKVVLYAQSSEGLYWRGITYDTYTGRTWRNNDRALLDRPSSQPVSQANWLSRRRVTVTIETLVPRNDLYFVPDEPVRLNRPYRVQTSSREALENLADFSALRARRIFGGPTKYTVEAMVPSVSANELRNASTQYPPGMERYLQLPPDLPRRVTELAEQWTAGATNPHDKAVAIERQLRRFPFDLDIKPPPSGRDAVDYYLFDVQRGFCDYTASAMVVMLRHLGIPARLATGYFSGTYDENSKRYVVTEEDAHTWPEVFYPGYGWIAYEPSGYRPAIIRPEDTGLGYEYEEYDEYGDLSGVPIDRLPGDELPEDVGTVSTVRRTSGVPWLPVLLLAALAAGGYYLFNRLRENRLPPHERIRAIYRAMVRTAGWLGVPPLPSQTPLEYTRYLVAKLEEAAERDGRVSTLTHALGLVPVRVSEVQTIGETYARTTYSHHLPAEHEEAEAVAAWSRLRWPLFLLLFRPRQKS